MPTDRVIPCLDVRDGRVVKGVQFKNLEDAGSPAALAQRYEAEGADEIAVLDVSATTQGRSAALETVRAVRAAVMIPVVVGGGVRSVDDAERILEAGADRVAVNSAAVVDPSLLDRLAERFGCQCVVLALDAAVRDDGFEVVTRSGETRTGLDALAWAREAAARGAGEILLTSVDRDGTKSGYDLELVARVAQAVAVPVVASGGAAGPVDLLRALEAGAQAALAASLFHRREHTIGEVKSFLASRGRSVRP